MSLSGCETLYSSEDQFARSMIRQRSEQKGRVGLFSHSVGFPHIGHFIDSSPPLLAGNDTTIEVRPQPADLIL